MKNTGNPFYQGMRGQLGDWTVTQQNGQTVVRAKPYRSTRVTDEQMSARLAFQRASGMWKTLLPVQMLSWRTIAPKIPRWDAPRNAVPLNGQQAFVGTAMNRFLLDLEPLLLAPFVPTLPPFLCEWTVRQLGTGADFQLLLDCDGYDGWVQILTTPPMSTGRDVVGVKRYATLTAVPGLLAGVSILTDLYRERYGALWDFQHIGVRLCPLSAQGFRGPSVTQASVLPQDVADVLQPAAAAEREVLRRVG